MSAVALDWHWEMVGLTMSALLAGSVCLVATERRSRGTLPAGSRLAIFGVTGTLSVLAVWSLVGNQALFAGRDAVERKDWAKRATMPVGRARCSCGRPSRTSFAATPPRVSVIAKARSAPTETRSRRTRATGSHGCVSPRSRAAPRGPPRTTGCVNSIPVSRIYPDE